MNITNRRNFIKTGSAGAFFIAAGGRAFGANAPSNRIRLCIVGCARTAFDGTRYTINAKGPRGRGFQVMMSALKVSGCEIAALCDVDTTALDFAKREVRRIAGVEPKCYRDMREAFQDETLDAFVIATPDHWHVTAGIWAMHAKKALYLEKPIGIAPGEAKVLARVQKETNAIFQLGTQRRSAYASRMAVAAIRSGKYGEARWAKAWCLTDRPKIKAAAWQGPAPENIDWEAWQGPAPHVKRFRPELVHYNWRFFRGYGTGDLPNNGLHFVDIARWALGAGWATDIYAGGGKLFYPGEDFEYEDTQMLNVKFADGKFLTWEGCSHSGAKPFMNQCTGTLVYCDDALVNFGPGGETAIYDRSGKKEIASWKADEMSPEQKAGGINAGAGIAGADDAHVANFIACVREGNRNTAAPIDEAIKSDLLPICGNVSLLTGEAVHIDPNSGELRDPNCAAAKFWMPKYETGWELKA